MQQCPVSFSQLIKPHTTSLYNTAKRITLNRSDAEDLVQETMLKAFRSMEKYQPETNFKAWVFKILFNTYISAYRKRCNTPPKISFHDIEDNALYKSQEYTPTTTTFNREHNTHIGFNDEIKNALDKIPEKYSIVITLHDVEGFSYTEISKIISAPLGTVMSRLFRGRRILKRRLTGYARIHGYIQKVE